MADLKISQLTGATTPLAGTEVLPIVQSSTTKQVSVANLTAGRAIAALSGSFGSSGTGANLNTKPNAYGLGTAIVPSFVMESNASGGTATLPSSQGAVIWGTAASPTASINLVQTNPSASSRNYLSFSTTANGTYQETFRLADLGDINVPIGNIVPGTAAKGINFTANSAAAGKTSQLLNYYEEGTWTPVITALSGSYTTVDSQAGYYTKIGRLVYVNAVFRVVTKGTGTVGAKISGLPFTVATIRSTGSATNGSNVNACSLYIPTGNTYIEMYKYDGTDPIVDNYTFFLTAFYLA